MAELSQMKIIISYSNYNFVENVTSSEIYYFFKNLKPNLIYILKLGYGTASLTRLVGIVIILGVSNFQFLA